MSRVGPGFAGAPDLAILRDGSEKHLNVKLDEASESQSARRSEGGSEREDQTALGVSVVPLTPDLAARVRAPKDGHGLLVEGVSPAGRAAAAGIQAGDVIQEVNRQPVKSIEDLRSALKKAADRPTLVLISRQGNDIFLTVRPANG